MKYSFLLLLKLGTCIASGQTAIKVNQQRIESRIFELAKFGKDSLGRGYRVAYTKGDQEGRAWYMALIKKPG